jgi:hypothetical protein
MSSIDQCLADRFVVRLHVTWRQLPSEQITYYLSRAITHSIHLFVLRRNGFGDPV